MRWLEPRNETSKNKKFSSIPRDYCQLVENALSEKYLEKLGEHTFEVCGSLYPTEIQIVVSFFNSKDISRENFCGSIDYDPKQQKDSYDKIQFCVDAIDSMLEQWIQDQEIKLPYDWISYKFEEQEVFLQHNRRNPSLELQADALLKDEKTEITEEELGEEFFTQPEEKEKKWH